VGKVETLAIGCHRVVIAAHENVWLSTPYSLLLAENIPNLAGLTVIDIGTGSGILGIVASLQGATRVYILDTSPAAIAAAMDNAERNGVRMRFVPLAVGDTIIPLPCGETVDVVISNPPQLPLPKPEANNPNYAGSDGRDVVEKLIRETPARLSAFGRLLVVLNSVSDFPKSLALMKSVGLEPRVLAKRSIELRPLFDRNWLDQLGGTSRGLYTVRDGKAYETIYAIEAPLQ
jgi:methylase of polypeptide subunit release factors